MFRAANIADKKPVPWYSPLMGSSSDIRRRGLGAFFLLAALGMLVAGETLLRERMSPLVFLLFWLVCLLFTCLALFIAFLDVTAIRRRIRDEQRALFENTLRDIARRKQPDPPTRPEQDIPRPHG